MLLALALCLPSFGKAWQDKCGVRVLFAGRWRGLLSRRRQIHMDELYALRSCMQKVPLERCGK